ncbi:hypothetical protein BH18ACT5_BH18ACT5_12740 [soil metagenome]
MTDPGGMPPRDPAMPPREPMMPSPDPVMPPPDMAMPPAPTPPPPASATGAGAPADLGTRFVARLIDGIILGVVNAIVASILFGGFISPYGFAGFSGRLFLYLLIGAAISIAYFAFMESSRGQTIGKMAMSIRTEAPGGGNPTMEQAVKRNAWYALNIIPVIGGLAQLAIIIYIAVTINGSPTRTGWHDTFAGGTRGVKTK